MMTANTIGLSELDALLTRLGAKLCAHEVHALYLGALTSTCLGLGPQRLVEIILGDDVPLGHGLDNANATVSVLFGYWNTLVAQRDAGNVRFAGCGPPRPSCRDTLRQFAERRHQELRWYIRGIDAGGDDPFEFGDEGRELLGRLAEASGFFEKYTEMLGRPDAASEDTLQEAQTLLGDISRACEQTIADLMAVTGEVRLEALATSTAMQGRRTADGVCIAGPTPRAARNAPCPCGSGKKWKHCCASPERLN